MQFRKFSTWAQKKGTQSRGEYLQKPNLVGAVNKPSSVGIVPTRLLIATRMEFNLHVPQFGIT